MAAEYPHGDRSWWQAARFGMFIHWGCYSVPARGEPIQLIEKIPPEVYAERYAANFHPDKFEPQKWAQAAKAAGMKYMVITAKHHDGFCMWDSKYTDFKADRDYIREVLEAFRAEGIRTGLYYSLLDWHHDQFTVDNLHPLAAGNREELNKNRDQRKYCEYMRNQITELLTEYGQIDVMWFDYTYPKDGKCAEDWEAEELLKLIRRLAPDILIDDRLGLPGSADFQSPEQYVPRDGMRNARGELLPWEGCQTFSGCWGYSRDETTWKTPHQLITMLVAHVARGGNLLLNVGPDARGRFDKRAINALTSIAEWMDEHADSIYNCTIAPEEFTEPDNCMYTYNPDAGRLYLHIFSYPVKFLFLPGLYGRVKFARFLNDHSEVKMLPPPEHNACMMPSASPDTLVLHLPPVAPDVTVPVVELILE